VPNKDKNTDFAKLEDVLNEINQAMSKGLNGEVKVPSLFIVCEDYDVASGLAKRYSTVLDEAEYFSDRGRETYCNLVFPKENEKDEKLFFASPRRVAATRNRFYGTMSISLQEFDGSDLINSNSFKNLMTFIEDNTDNIQFVIYVKTSFSMKRQLFTSLSAITPFKLVYTSTSKDRIDVIRDEFNQRGYFCDDAVMNRVSSILDKIDAENELSVKALMSRIDYEMSISDGMNVIQDVVSKIEQEYSDTNISDGGIVMGFRPR